MTEESLRKARTCFCHLYVLASFVVKGEALHVIFFTHAIICWTSLTGSSGITP